MAVGSGRVGSGRVRGARARPPGRARERADRLAGPPTAQREVSGVILLHMVSHFN